MFWKLSQFFENPATVLKRYILFFIFLVTIVKTL